MFHRETPGDAAKDKDGPTLAKPVKPTATPPNPELGEKANSHKRPGLGTRWGLAVQRLSSQEGHRVRGVGRKVPSNPKALAPERKAPSAAALGTSGPIPAVEEVWFAGCHSDVGGGAVEDVVRYSLADISLRWMVKQVIMSQCGIRFDAAALRRADIDISNIVLDSHTQAVVEEVCRMEREAENVAGPSVSSGDSSGEDAVQKGKGKDSEEQNWPQEQDVLSDLHDELKLQPMWWILEVMPMKFTWQDPDGNWKSKWGYAFKNATL